MEKKTTKQNKENKQKKQSIKKITQKKVSSEKENKNKIEKNSDNRKNKVQKNDNKNIESNKNEANLVEEDKIKKIQVTKEEKKILENKTKKSNNIFKRFINKLKPQENKFNFIEMLLLMFIAFIVGIFASEAISLKIPILNNTTVIEDTSEITRVYNLIINRYYKDVDSKELTNAAIKGMMNYLSDDYSVYFTEEEKENFNERLNGSYVGLGIEVANDDNNNAIIVNVFDNTPAKEAGLLPLDIIKKINDEDVSSLGKDEVVKKIKGKNNYSFNMTVERDGKLIDVSLTTSSIILDSVFSKLIEEDNKKIGYMYISIFALNTYEQFNKQLLELEKQNIDSLIIDVRDNSGGHLSSVTDILNLFLNKNQVLYQVKSKDKIKKVYGTTDNDRKYNIVVLTNEFSASASEILASAIKEAYGGKTVGVKTFGKGTMQNLIDLDNGGMIKVTTEIWLTSSGNEINEVGVPVDYEVFLDENYKENPCEETDNQLQKAIEVLKDE